MPRRTSGCLDTVHTARRQHACEGFRCNGRRSILPGHRYTRSALPPGGEIGNTGWWTMRICGDCQPITTEEG